MEDWTAEIAKNMFGNSLYQKRAREALPLLVRQALAQQEIPYANLAEELGMPNPRNLNFVLGSIGTTLAELSQRWHEDVPPIQCLVVNQQTGLPGSGVDPMIDASNMGKLDPRQKETLIKSIFARIFGYPKWLEVLKELGLPASDFSNFELINSAGRSGGGGESEAHRDLKNHIAIHPECIGLSPTLPPGETEFLLPSGDIVDVVFKGKRRRIGIEVKSQFSDEADIMRGLFQCVKYLAVLRATRSWEGGSYELEVILAIGGVFPRNLVSVRNLLGVRVIEGVKIESGG